MSDTVVGDTLTLRATDRAEWPWPSRNRSISLIFLIETLAAAMAMSLLVREDSATGGLKRALQWARKRCASMGVQIARNRCPGPPETSIIQVAEGRSIFGRSEFLAARTQAPVY